MPEKAKPRYWRSSESDVKSEMHRYKRGTAKEEPGAKAARSKAVSRLSPSDCQRRERRARRCRRRLPDIADAGVAFERCSRLTLRASGAPSSAPYFLDQIQLEVGNLYVEPGVSGRALCAASEASCGFHPFRPRQQLRGQYQRSASARQCRNHVAVAGRAATIGIFLLLFVAFLYVSRGIVMPLLAAAVVALTLSPLMKRAKAHGIPPWIASGLIVVFVLGALGIAATALAGPISEWISRAPEIGATIQDRLSVLQRPLASLKELRARFSAAAREHRVLHPPPTSSCQWSLFSLRPPGSCCCSSARFCFSWSVKAPSARISWRSSHTAIRSCGF